MNWWKIAIGRWEVWEFSSLVSCLAEKTTMRFELSYNILKIKEMSLSTMAYREVDTIVSSWTTKYQYHISLVESKPTQVKYTIAYLQVYGRV